MFKLIGKKIESRARKITKSQDIFTGVSVFFSEFIVSIFDNKNFVNRFKLTYQSDTSTLRIKGDNKSLSSEISLRIEDLKKKLAENNISVRSIIIS